MQIRTPPADPGRLPPATTDFSIVNCSNTWNAANLTVEMLDAMGGTVGAVPPVNVAHRYSVIVGNPPGPQAEGVRFSGTLDDGSGPVPLDVILKAPPQTFICYAVLLIVDDPAGGPPMPFVSSLQQPGNAVAGF